MNDLAPTPETDAFVPTSPGGIYDLARELERKRNEFREALEAEREVKHLGFELIRRVLGITGEHTWEELAAEVQVVREERDQLSRELSSLLAADCLDGHDAVEGAQNGIAMREAIQMAYAALRAWPKAGSGMSTDHTLQSQAFRTGQAALTKLEPFLP